MHCASDRLLAACNCIHCCAAAVLLCCCAAVLLVLLVLQIMPPFDPEMVEPMQEKLRAKGVELCLG